MGEKSPLRTNLPNEVSCWGSGRCDTPPFKHLAPKSQAKSSPSGLPQSSLQEHQTSDSSLPSGSRHPEHPTGRQEAFSPGEGLGTWAPGGHQSALGGPIESSCSGPRSHCAIGNLLHPCSWHKPPSPRISPLSAAWALNSQSRGLWPEPVVTAQLSLSLRGILRIFPGKA